VYTLGETLEVKENWSEQGYEHSGNETLQKVTNTRKKCKYFWYKREHYRCSTGKSYVTYGNVI
jgi:hypothetical protein